MTETCDICGDEFENAAGLGAHKHYQHENPRDRVEVECAHCATAETILESQRQDQYENWFCSMDCRDAWMSEAFEGVGRFGGEIVETQCERCGETVERYESQTREKVFCSHDCCLEWQQENAEYPSAVTYATAEWRELRKTVRERDGCCQSCGADGSDEMLDVHHIRPVEEFDDPMEAHYGENCVLLCRGCHRSLHQGGEIEVAKP